MSPGGEPLSLPPTRAILPVLRNGDRCFGRFVLEHVLGRGGMGVVWQARDEMLEESVALKLLTDPVTCDPRSIADLRAETRRARQLAHPNLVRIHEFFADADGAAISMELVDGQSLAARLAQQGVLSADEILRWLPGLCAALDYAHREAGFVHRDIKPGNLLLTSGGEAKLADFGISCRLAEAATRCTHLLASGTLAYMSPQQLAGEDPAPSDDIHALGALLYEAVAGRPPFQGGDMSLQIRQRVPRAPGALRPGEAPPLPRVWDEVILACLAKDPACRPATAGEVAAALSAGCFRRRGQCHRRALIAGSAMLATAVVVAGSVMAFFRSATPDVTSVSAQKAAAAPADAVTLATAESLPPISAPRFVRGSLAQQLVAHLPLDGGAENCAADLAPGVSIGASWTEDRFGRADSAVRFAGHGRIELPLGRELFRLGPTYPLTLSAWVRLDRADGAMLTLSSGRKGSTSLLVSVQQGRLYALLSNARTMLSVTAPQALATDRWAHTAVVYDGATLKLYIDGRQIAENSWAQDTPAEESIRLIVGAAKSEWANDAFFGAIDDVRLYRHALGPDALRSLALEDAPIKVKDAGEPWYPWEGGPVIALTRGRYGDQEDLDAVVRREFGDGARVADWDDLGAAWNRWPRLAAELAGWLTQQNSFLTRKGTRVFNGERVYNLTRVDGIVFDGFLEHGEIGGHTFALGSWMGEDLPALVRLSATGRYHVEAVGTGADVRAAGATSWTRDGAGVWRRALAFTDGEAMFCLRMPVDFSPAGSAEQSIRLLMDDGAIWRIAVNPVPTLGDRRISIERGDGAPAERVQLAANPSLHELVLVGRTGHIYVALIDQTNGAWRGDLAVDSLHCAMTALREIVVTGAALDARPAGEQPAHIQWVVWR